MEGVYESLAGQLLSLSELARDVGIAPNTAKSWISILETSRQIFLLEPYHSSAGKRLIKTPNLYSSDPGMLTYLLGFTDWESVIRNAAWGAVWENFVIGEVYKHFYNLGKRPPCGFWRTVQGEEVDLLIEVGSRQFLAIQCKPTACVESNALKGFAEIEKSYGTQALKKAAVICRTESPSPLAPRSRMVAQPLVGSTLYKTNRHS